ncbi:hypothetical protein [Haloglomus halophilum]|uniref:hypothetical protein n=1 Tax=Haloglomus halophilum TaxID=2962672 RepID=UPI0020CA23E7|nr:hypothetical protein [Haloglomus halophilum]
MNEESSEWSRRELLKGSSTAGLIGLAGGRPHNTAAAGEIAEPVSGTLSTDVLELLETTRDLRRAIPWLSAVTEDILRQQLEAHIDEIELEAKLCRWDAHLFETPAAQAAFAYFDRTDRTHDHADGVLESWRQTPDRSPGAPAPEAADRHLVRGIAANQLAAELSETLSELSIPDEALIRDGESIASVLLPIAKNHRWARALYGQNRPPDLVADDRWQRVHEAYIAHPDVHYSEALSGLQKLALIVNTPRLDIRPDPSTEPVGTRARTLASWDRFYAQYSITTECTSETESERYNHNPISCLLR